MLEAPGAVYEIIRGKCGLLLCSLYKYYHLDLTLWFVYRMDVYRKKKLRYSVAAPMGIPIISEIFNNINMCVL